MSVPKEDMCVFFFFSSRRRHTRCSRDWSSDVCSSDLAGVAPAEGCRPPGRSSRAAVPTAASSGSSYPPRPFLRLELVQRRPYGGRADPLDAAVHIFDAAAPHHTVFARANPEAPRVLAHVPVLLPPTPGVTLRRVGQLLVRKHRALQSQEDAQSTLKVIGRDGHASSLFRSTKLRKWSGSLRFCNSR